MKPSTILPDTFLRRMSPADRPAGKAGMTNEQAQAKYAKGQEKKLQTDCANLLRQRNIWFQQMPYGRKTPWPGWPDFIVFYNGKTMMIECKVAGGKVSEDQIAFVESLKEVRCSTIIYRVIFHLSDLQNILST